MGEGGMHTVFASLASQLIALDLHFSLLAGISSEFPETK